MALATKLLEDAYASDTLRPEDVALLRDIEATKNPRDMQAKLYTYYTDADRADRTPRPVLYLHMGIQFAVVRALLAEKS